MNSVSPVLIHSSQAVSRTFSDSNGTRTQGTSQAQTTLPAGLHDSTLNADIAKLFAELPPTEKLLVNGDPKLKQRIADRAMELAQRVFQESSTTFKASDLKPNGDRFSFDVRTSNKIKLPNKELSFAEYQELDAAARDDAKAYLGTRHSQKEGYFRTLRLEGSTYRDLLEVIFEGNDIKNLKPLSISHWTVYKRGDLEKMPKDSSNTSAKPETILAA